MWIFTSGAYLLPCASTAADNPEYTLGYRDLQVRGRLIDHLHHFTETFMDPYDLDRSDVIPTPGHDYTCRFWTTKDAFADAMGHAVRAIDYRHFKDTSLDRLPNGQYKYAGAKAYHDALIEIWSVSTRISPPGGFYGSYFQKKNPVNRWDDVDWGNDRFPYEDDDLDWDVVNGEDDEDEAPLVSWGLGTPSPSRGRRKGKKGRKGKHQPKPTDWDYVNEVPESHLFYQD